MATVPNKKYSDLLPLRFFLRDDDRSLDLSVPNKFNTQQGLNLLEYNFLLSANDVKNKNYTTNYLTSPKTENEIFDLNLPQGLNTAIPGTIQFYDADRPMFLNIGKTNSNLSAAAFITPLSTTTASQSAQTFTISTSTRDNDTVCQIYTFDGKFKKYLVQHNNYKQTSPSIIFDVLSATSGNDWERSIFTLQKDPEQQEFRLAITKNTRAVGPQSDRTNTDVLTTGVVSYIVPARAETISVNDYNATPLTAYHDLAITSILSANLSSKDVFRDTNYNDYSNNFAYYALTGFELSQSETLSGQQYNFLMYSPYEINTISGSEVNSTLRYFNLKNQISNDNNVNKNLPFENPQRQREYTSILNTENSETSDEDLKLGYNFYTAEYVFKSDKFTKFVLPDSLGQFEKINLQDAQFEKNGAFAAKSPYFSDKIYKQIDNRDSVNLKNQSQGKYLCSWLYDNDGEGIWYDRYFIPVLSATNLAAPVSGNLNYVNGVLGENSDVVTILRNRGLSAIQYYDLDTTLMLEPSGTYFYSRIGKDYVNKVIGLQKEKQLKNSILPINAYTKAAGLSSTTLTLNGSTYDTFRVNAFDVTGFNLSFDVKAPSLSELKAYNLAGNLYNTGIAIQKNFYYTPFLYFQHLGDVHFYDTDFNLLKKVSFPGVDSIEDIPYLVQNGDFCMIINGPLGRRFIRGNFAGDVEVVATDPTVDTILTSDNLRTSRCIYNIGPKASFKRVTALPGPSKNVVIDIDLQSCQSDSLTEDNAQGDYGETSIIRRLNDTEYTSMSGMRGCNLNDDITVSLSGDNVILFKDHTRVNEPAAMPDMPSSPTGAQYIALSSAEKIWDINTFDELLYIQTGNSGSPPKLKIVNSERQLLSTFNLSTSAVSGAKIEFISENYIVKPIAISRDSDYNLIVDKITTTLSGTSGFYIDTYNLGITGVDMGYHVGRFVDDQSGSTRNGLPQNGRLMNPTGMYFLNNTYKQYENQFNLITRFNNEFTRTSVGRHWEDVAIDWNDNETGNWSFNYGAQGAVLSDSSTITTLSTLTDGGGCISINADLLTGKIELYAKGQLEQSYFVDTGIKPLKNYLNNDFFLGVPNLGESPITDVVTNQNFAAQNASLENFFAYNQVISKDLIQYHCLAGQTIDDLVLDIVCGVRSNKETINRVYTYKIPGSISNQIGISISDGNLNPVDAELLADDLAGRLSEYLPGNIDTVNFNFGVGNIYKGIITRSLRNKNSSKQEINITEDGSTAGNYVSNY